MKRLRVDLDKWEYTEADECQFEVNSLDPEISFGVRGVDVEVSLESEHGLFPLYNGGSNELTVAVKGFVYNLVIIGASAYWYTVNGRSVREYPDQRPMVVYDPGSRPTSMQEMVQQEVSKVLTAHGVTESVLDRGHDYSQQWEEDETGDDPEFGPGYAVDPQIEAELNDQAERTLRTAQEVAEARSRSGGTSPSGGDDKRLRTRSEPSYGGSDTEPRRMEPPDSDAGESSSREDAGAARRGGSES